MRGFGGGGAPHAAAAPAAAARNVEEIPSAADYFLVLERPVASEPAHLVDRYPAEDSKGVSVDDKLSLLLLCGFPPASAPARRDAEFFVIVMAHGGERSFGACLLSPDGARLLCVLSRRPLYALFRCFLSSVYHLVETAGGGRRWAPHPLEHYIVNFVDETAAPKAGECVELELWDGSCTRYSFPLPLSLPHVDDLCFECLAAHLAPAVVVDLVIELLLEQSIVLLATRLGPLAFVGEALLALLYPFQWCFPYIPVLPVQDSEHRVLLGMPVPALLGIDKALAANLSSAFARRLNGKICVDVDSGTVQRPPLQKGDAATPLLPAAVRAQLVRELGDAFARRIPRATTLTAPPLGESKAWITAARYAVLRALLSVIPDPTLFAKPPQARASTAPMSPSRALAARQKAAQQRQRGGQPKEQAQQTAEIDEGEFF